MHFTTSPLTMTYDYVHTDELLIFKTIPHLCRASLCGGGSNSLHFLNKSLKGQTRNIVFSYDIEMKKVALIFTTNPLHHPSSAGPSWSTEPYCHRMGRGVTPAENTAFSFLYQMIIRIATINCIVSYKLK